MTLDSLCGQYSLERDIAPDTAKWLRYVAGRYSRWLKHPATVIDLADQPVNEWLAALLVDGLTRRTVRGYRGALVMLWRYAVEIGLLDAPPKRLRRIKVPKLIPQAWTQEEVGRLLTQAVAFSGFYRCGVRRSTYWLAVVLAIWESGLRIGDLLRLRKDQIGADGRVCVTQRKTSWPVVFRFSERTMVLVREITAAHDGPLLFGGVVSRKWVFVTFKRLATNACLTGGTKKIRKSGATAVERDTKGAAPGYLGHKGGTVAYEFYVDPTQAGIDKPAPPPLRFPGEQPPDAA